MFQCGSCRSYRNDWDNVGNNICLNCSSYGVTRPTQKVVNTSGGFGGPSKKIVENSGAVGKNVKLPCKSCKSFIGPKEGQMMRDGSVYCMTCLNTGKYLHVGKTGEYTKKGSVEDYMGGKKPQGRFGR